MTGPSLRHSQSHDSSVANHEGPGMRVIIAGSRSISNFAIVCEAVRRSGFPIGRVLSGMARGVDSLAVRYAAENDLPLDPFPAQWSKWGRSAGYKRNVEMARHADALIAVWDGNSPGTQHMLDVAKAHGLRVFVMRLPST